MKTNITQRNFKHKHGCGCKMCKYWKGRGGDTRTVRDRKFAESHQQQIDFHGSPEFWKLTQNAIDDLFKGTINIMGQGSFSHEINIIIL